MDDVLNAGNQTEVVTSLDDFEILPEGFEDGMDMDEDGNFFEQTEGQEDSEELEELDDFDDETVDEVDDESNEESEESEESEETDNEDVEEEDIKPSLGDLEVKFLHETKKISEFEPDELKTFIQLGMNAERVQAQHDEITNEFDEIAEMYGVSRDGLITTLRDQVLTAKAENEKRHIDDVRKEYNSSKKSLLDKRIERFVEKYPDIKVDELPKEVLQAAKLGNELTESYEAHLKDNTIKDKDTEIESLKAQIADLKKAQKVAKQNKKVKKKGIIKPTSGSDSPQSDDFMDGLFSQ